jgi:hypothetical protein
MLAASRRTDERRLPADRHHIEDELDASRRRDLHERLDLRVLLARLQFDHARLAHAKSHGQLALRQAVF